MININKDTVTDIVGLIALGAVGLIVGRLYERKVIDSELADMRNNIEWQEEQIQTLKDVYTEEIFDKE